MLKTIPGRARRGLRRLRSRLRRLGPDRDYRSVRQLYAPYAGPRSISRVFYINLESSADRRAAVEHALDALGAPRERFPGIDGTAQREQYRAYLDGRSPVRRQVGVEPPDPDEASTVPGGVLGCWLSHVHLLKRIATLEEGLYLVMEDDYQLPTDWENRLRVILGEIRDDWDLLKLFSVSTLGKPRLRGVRCSQHLVRLGPAMLTAQNLSTAAYIVRHEGDRVGRLVRVIDELPVIHLDGALNLAMDEVRCYAPVERFGRLTPHSTASVRDAVSQRL
jgi:hypothetical protein